MSKDALFPSPRRRGGRHSSAYQRSLSALLADGRLAGDEHAATRATLREMAETVDRSAQHVRDGETTPYAHMMTVRHYLDALERLVPAGHGSIADEVAEFLADADTA